MVKVRDRYAIFTMGHLLFHVVMLPTDVLGIYEDRVLCNKIMNREWHLMR